MIPLQFRTCLFHPRSMAVSWSGHVHIDTPIRLDDHLIVGLCSHCAKWIDEYTRVNGPYSNQDRGCMGCYGNYTGTLR